MRAVRVADWSRLRLLSLVGFVSLLGWAPPARAENARRETAWDALHAHVTATAVTMALGRRYDIEVSHPSGRFGAVDVPVRRYGAGAGISGGLGVNLSPGLALGVSAEYSRVYAPVDNEFMDEIGARYDPWVASWLIGLFVEKRWDNGLHLGAAVGGARVREVLEVPERRVFTDGSYGVKLFMGKDSLVTGDTRLRLGVRLGVVDANPFAFFPTLAFRESFFPNVMRAADVSFAVGLEFK